MGNILLLFLVLFPMLLSAWVFPLRRRDRRYRNWLIQIIPAVELAAALLLLLWPGAALELPGVFGFGLRLQAGSLGSLLALVSAFLWAATGLNCPSYFAAAEGCNRFYFFWLLTLGALMGVFLAADLLSVEFEYLYVDKEISVDKILNKTKRKKVEKFETERMEIFAPINSWHLDNMKNRQLKVTDYSSGVAGQPDRRYVMIYSGDRKIIFEPSEAMVKALQSVAPRKVFFD